MAKYSPDAQGTTSKGLIPFIKRIWPDREKQLSKWKLSWRAWYQRTLDSLTQLIALSCATWLVLLVLLYFCHALWFIYLHTPVGFRYASAMSASTAQGISKLIDMNLFKLSFNITATALVTCLVLGAASRLLLMKTYLFDGRGIINRLFWGALCNALASYKLRNYYHVDFQIAFIFESVPILCLFGNCFTFTSKTLPELTIIWDLKTFIIKGLATFWNALGNGCRVERTIEK